MKGSGGSINKLKGQCRYAVDNVRIAKVSKYVQMSSADCYLKNASSVVTQFKCSDIFI